MRGFLQRLFHYRATEGRTPLEDFLSEVLADLMERMPRAEAKAFILQCFVPDALQEPARAFMQGQRVDVRTQVRLPDGRRLDVLLEVAGQPFIIVENKVRAAFQMHARPARPAGVDPPGDTVDEMAEGGGEPPALEQDHQLATYGRWLAEAPKVAGWPGVITLLSHAAQAPMDFVAGDVERYGAVPHSFRWRSLHDRLRRLVGTGPGDPEMPPWTFLARELCAFLEHHGLDSSDMNPVDIASINVALGPLRKLDAVYAEIGADLLQQHPGDLVRKGQSCEFKPEHSRFWGWTYFAGPGQWYVGYGVYFAPAAGDLASTAPPLPDQEHAFVAFGGEERALDPGPSGFPPGWVQVAGWYAMKAFPLSDRRSEERFPQFMARLVQGVFPTLLEMRDGQPGHAGAPEA